MTASRRREEPLYLNRFQLDGVDGVVVVIDVLRAFSTAAYALGAGARTIHLVGGLEEAVELGRSIPGALVVGEERGRKPPAFDLPNSPFIVSRADVAGRVLVLRTSSGTQGVMAAVDADRLFVAGLATASATAAAVTDCGLGAPAYVLTGWLPDWAAEDDRATAEHIEAVRTAESPDPVAASEAVRASPEAFRTLEAGEGNMDPRDVDFAADVDRFAFAMEVRRIEGRLTITTDPRASASSDP
ncbi:MAG: 2-phosphosulfolactate phosphatase [Acidimicrobiales bacterium]|nr:2-phosphosulfolactate phosphatase [Acidimicrobiales bacterium]